MPRIEIRNQFSLYNDLVKHPKVIQSEKIFLEEKGSNKKWLSKSTNAFLSSLDANVSFIVECRKSEINYYGIKLRYPPLIPLPYFRLDSDGPAHRNMMSYIPLEKQLVTTPHFNCFDEEGNEFAYKTKELENPVEAAAICKNINFGIAHFCNETNSGCANENYPVIEGIDFETILLDPLESIKFED
jgi:hypothetical protein